MYIAGEASVLDLSFQGVVIALCRLFPLSEDGRGLSLPASVHRGLWVIKNIHSAAFGDSYLSTALLCRSQILKMLAGVTQITLFFIILNIFCVCVTMEEMANKYKDMVLGEFVSMGGLDS